MVPSIRSVRHWTGGGGVCQRPCKVGAREGNTGLGSIMAEMSDTAIGGLLDRSLKENVGRN